MALSKITNGGVATSGMPSESIIQVKEGSATTEVAHQAAWEDTGLSVSITPTSTSSKILIIVNQQCYRTGAGGGALRILRDSTTVFQDAQVYQSYGNELSNRHFHNMQYIDSPSTTSAIIYKTQAYEHSGDWRTQQGGLESRIIVMEIAG